MTAIIDYGAGNLMSVKKALDHIGAANFITSSPSEIAAADSVILPGVGSFGDAMAAMERSGLVEAVRAAALSGKPFLGICLGLQLLFGESEESPGAHGLGVLQGKISRIPASLGLKVPHMGWNSVCISPGSRLFDGVQNGEYFYFVHSYYLNGANAADVAATAQYGVTIQCAAERGNLFATQFHPEKSGAAGLKVLKNFVSAEGKICTQNA